LPGAPGSADSPAGRSREEMRRDADCSQGVATLANAFHDELFIRQEVADMCAWLKACAEDGRNGRRDQL
jgi:hypothetical protein